MASDIWLRTILIVRKETRCRHIGYSYRLTARVLLYAPSHRQEHWLEREIAQWVHPMKDQSDDPSHHERTLYLWARSGSPMEWVRNIITPGGAGRSSEVERSLMVRWVVGSILHGVDPLSYFSFQPVLDDWCNKGCGMCYPVCGMVHIKEPLLLIDKSSLCGGSGFPFSLSEWSLTICLTPYNRR